MIRGEEQVAITNGLSIWLVEKNLSAVNYQIHISEWQFHIN